MKDLLLSANDKKSKVGEEVVNSKAGTMGVKHDNLSPPSNFDSKASKEKLPKSKVDVMDEPSSGTDTNGNLDVWFYQKMS